MSNYVCPCPDGCNGCEVPDFAIKEIERLQARVAKLEAEIAVLKKIPMYVKPCAGEESRCVACDCTEEDQLHDPYCPVATYQALANSEGENNDEYC